MIRKPGSAYVDGRSSALLKVKSFRDAEARVLKHLPGAGRHKGRLGSLFVELPDGTTFSVGTGLSDAERETPPDIGSVIAFRYQGMSNAGVPRFPIYVGIRHDFEWPGEVAAASSKRAPKNKTSRKKKKKKKKKTPAKATAISTTDIRRFELSDGKANKFWEIELAGNSYTVRYGRIGTNGQARTKELADEAKATVAYDKVISTKVSNGYVEVAPKSDA